MSFLHWDGSRSSRSGNPRRAPIPPPRDPTGINNVVHNHVLGGAIEHGEEVGEEVQEGEKLVKTASSGESVSRKMNWILPPPSHSAGWQRRAVDDGLDSDSSSGGSSSVSCRDFDSKRPGGSSAMDEPSRQRMVPLRAVVTPTTVDRNRCSTYDNVDDAASYLGKPPLGSYPTPRTTRALTRNSPLQGDRSSPNACVPNRHHSSPVSFGRHYPNTDGQSSGVHRQSPSYVSVRSNSSSPSCAKNVTSCGRSTPRHLVMTEESPRASISSWKEFDTQQQQLEVFHDSDSADYDPVRRRPPSACKAPRSHRGSLPPGNECHGTTNPWHHGGACYPCVQSSPVRYHYWHGTVPPPSQTSGCCGGYAIHSAGAQSYNSEDLEQTLYQLESEKEHLMLQASVLTEQVEAQNEKIQELETMLKENKQQLGHSEEMLRQEMESRSSLENGKFELMAQVSALRIKLASSEQQRQEFEEKSSKLENELVLTCACLAEKEADIATLKSKTVRNGTVSPFADQESEIHKLKNALSAVIAANDEKDGKIQELKTTLNRYKKLQELVLSDHGRRASDVSIGYCSSPFADSNLDFIPEMNGKTDSYADSRFTNKPPPVPRLCLQPLATSSPAHEGHYNLSMRETQSLRCSPIPKNSFSSLPSHSSSFLSQRTRSSDNVSPPSKTPPARRHYGTMPRQHGNDVLLQIHHQLQQHKLEPSSNSSSLDRSVRSSPNTTSQSSQNLHHPGLETFRQSRTKTSGVSFGKGFFRLRSGKRSSSAPELAMEEAEGLMELPDTVHSPRHVQRSSSPVKVHSEKPRGLRRIFGKLKRTGSENLNANAAEFKRGGIRATAGPRLGWGQDGKKFENFNIPFAQWNTSVIVDWMHSLGLGMYANECKKWVKNGDQLLKARSSDFEKELGIKNHMHKKKLLLAICGAKGKDVEPYQMIDYHWVVRWLDDIGLPQYKDLFFDSRIDGNVLHHLTVEDLFNLKVTNQLHHISIKRGIHVLRENNFNPQCLKRRHLQGDSQTPAEVSRWTNHRVMEWLRTVDLSEYAPNLRGSGVHGALMVYEPRFNADLLASLLNIPPSKTLLRRHLCSQFKQLVGTELMQKKREWEAQSSYSPLSPSAKVKIVRRGQRSLMKKRNKSELEFEDYVCPMDILGMCNASESPLVKSCNNKVSSEEHDEAERFLSKEEKTTRSLEEEANEAVNALNDLLKDEKAFENLASTVV